MKTTVKIYRKKDPQQYRDKTLFWSKQSSDYKIQTLETIRYQWFELDASSETAAPRLRRVLSIIKRS